MYLSACFCINELVWVSKLFKVRFILTLLDRNDVASTPIFMRKLRLRKIVAKGHSGSTISTQTPGVHFTGLEEEVGKGIGVGR